MEELEGTIKTPFGTMRKKTALVTGGIVVVLGGIVYWREKQSGKLNASSTDTTTGEIDPATGFVYGTPEDLAAIAAQNTGVGPGGQSPGGSGSIPPGGTTGTTGFLNNGEWSQDVIAYMTSNNLVEDPTQLSTALGRYLTGAFVDPDKDAALVSLIQQAIAVKGYPPDAGPHGFPPAINMQPGSSGPPSPPPGGPPPKPKPKPLPPRRYVVVAEYVTGHVVWNSTLSGIASRSGRSVSQLASWNGITNPNVIHTGSHIWIDPPTGFSGSVQWKG